MVERQTAKTKATAATSRIGKHPGFGFGAIKRRLVLYSFDERNQSWAVDPEVGRVLEIDGASVSIDGKIIPGIRANCSDISWAHEGNTTGFMAGRLSASRGALSFFGHISIGPSAEKCRMVSVFAGIPPTTYATKVAKAGAPQSGNVPSWYPPKPGTGGGNWNVGPSFIMGFTPSESGIPTAIWQWLPPDGNTGDAQDVSQGGFITPSINASTGALVIDMDGSSVIGDVPASFGAMWPALAQFELTPDGSSFSGLFQGVDTTTGEAQSETYYFVGTAQPPSTTHAGLDGVAAPSAGLRAAGHPRASAAADKAPAPTPAKSNPLGLSVAELLTLNPGNDEIQTQQNQILVENFKWATCQSGQNAPWGSATSSWLNDFFGQEPPVIPASQQALVTANIDFYTQKFGPSYIGYALNGTSQAGVSTHLSSQQSTDLQFFYRAGIGTSRGYNGQSKAIALQAFLAADSTGRLQDYVNDYNANLGPNGKPTSDAHDWPKRIYDALMKPQQLNITIQEIIATSGDMTKVNLESTIMAVIQPSGEWAQKYHNRVMAAIMGRAVEQYGFDDKADILKWLPDVIAAFIAQNINGANQYITDPEQRATAQAQAEELQTIADKLGGITSLADSISDVMVAVFAAKKQASFLENLAECETKLQKALNCSLKALTFLSMAGALFSVIVAFRGGWSNLNTVEKGQCVTTLVQVFSQFLDMVPGLLQGAKSLGLKFIVSLRSCFSSARGTEGILDATLLGEELDPDDSLAGLQQLFAETTTDVAEPAAPVVDTALFAAFRAGPIKAIAAGLSAAAAVAVAAFNTWKFIDDIEDGAPTQTEVLDGIIAVSAILEAGCIIAGLVFSASAALPICAGVFAVVGLVAALVEAFDPPPPPPSPAEVFMQGFVSCFAGGAHQYILSAPSGWDASLPVPTKNPYLPTPG